MYEFCLHKESVLHVCWYLGGQKASDPWNCSDILSNGGAENQAGCQQDKQMLIHVESFLLNDPFKGSQAQGGIWIQN